MNLNNKILPVALAAALLGGTVGAFVTRPSKSSEPQVAGVTATRSLNTVSPAENAQTAALEASETPNKNQTELDNLTGDQEAYRAGFTEGVRAAKEEGLAATETRTRTRTRVVPETRVVYRNRTRAARGSSANRVYYNYEQPRKRSFWSKHRDKLTVAMGAGGGAIVGGLIGGKKGAAIGALAGGGGSALYTYKLRKRDRRY